MNTAIMGTPDEIISTRIDVQNYIGQKMQAFAAHKTQIAPDNFVFTLSEEQRKQTFGYEYFVLARSTISAREGEMEQDMLADLD